MTPAAIHERLQGRFGDALLGFQTELHDPTVVVRPELLPEIARYLRDDDALRMDFLRVLTGLDRRPEAFEVVYHLFSYRHRHGIVLRVRLDVERPEVPTVSHLWPTADWQERETWDLLGIGFPGHPDLRRLLMPVDWVGHPLRKDYQKPAEYHGIPTTRPAQPTRAYLPAQHVAREAEVSEDGQWMQVNMGPHHPATHGVINFLIETDGEIMRRARPDIGYLHRGLEKLAEWTPYAGTMPYTDRIDYLGAMFTNHGWALAAERLGGIEVPRRAEFCRVIASELNRIASHLVATGSLAMDLGAFTPFIHWLREREKINDIMERICGARLTYNYMRFGGVSRDIDADTIDMIRRWLDHFEPMMTEFDRLITGNEIFVRRLSGIAVITPQDAIAYGLVGPNLRATGIDWDVRRHEPYSIYNEFDWEVVLGRGVHGPVGDAFDRYDCRLREIRESVKILRQACDRIPAGEARSKTAKIKPAPNETYARVEGPRGECGFYVVSDGTEKPYRSRFRTGSFTAMTIIEHLSPGLMIADLVALIGSLDVIAPEIDR